MSTGTAAGNVPDCRHTVSEHKICLVMSLALRLDPSAQNSVCRHIFVCVHREVKGRQRYLIVPITSSREQSPEWHPSKKTPLSPPPPLDPARHAVATEPMQHSAPDAPAASSEAVRTWAGFTAKRTNAEKAAADVASYVAVGGTAAGVVGGLHGPDDGAGGGAAEGAAGDPAAGGAEAAPAGSDDEDFDSLLARLTGSAATEGGYFMPPVYVHMKPITHRNP